MTIGVIAHDKKSLGGGLKELRTALQEAGIPDPLWYEVPRSSKAPKMVRKCLKKGVDLLIVWGGDGTVQRCIDALVKAGAGKKVALAILPAGTANLLAGNLGIPIDVRKAVEVALTGRRRKLDVGEINDEHFAVMAGAGFDAKMIRDASGEMKERLGRAAYVWTALNHMRDGSAKVRILADGEKWFSGAASCVVVGNVGTLMAGLKVFPDAEPDDGLLDVGVVHAENFWQWLTVFARSAVGKAEGSKHMSTTRAREIEIKLSRKLPYQLDGGDRDPAARFSVRAKHHEITVCVPAESPQHTSS